MENFFCKHLDLDFSVDLSIIEQFKTQASNAAKAFGINFIDTNLQNFLKARNIVAGNPVCFYTPPGSDRGFHHVDSTVIDNMVKLNFIVAEKNTVMQWFKFNGTDLDIIAQQNITGGGYLKFKPALCELIWEEELQSPSLVNAGIPHNVRNRSNASRWTISYPLFTLDGKHLQWQQAVEIFKIPQ